MTRKSRIAVPERSVQSGDRRWRLAARSADAWVRLKHNPSAMIIIGLVVQNVLRMGSNVVLARLLAPSAFALISITMLILVGLQMISDVGIAITALREGEMSKDDEAKLWTMQLIRGVGLAVLVFAVAVPIGWVYQDARVRDLLLALAVMPILQGAQSLFPVLALGHRRLLPSTLLELGGRTMAMAGSIAVALLYPTEWSLVIGTLAGAAFQTIGSHLWAGRFPRFVLDRNYIRRQWQFSRWVQASSTLSFVGMQIDKALFPFIFGMSALGLYGIGATFALLPSQLTQRWGSSVFYPLTVQLFRGDDRAKAQLLHVRTTMLLYTAIMTLSVAAIAPAFFLMLYEPRYHGAIRLAQIMAIGTFFELAESSLRHFPIVEGTPHYEVWTVVVRLAAFAAAVLVVIAVGGGVAGYALSYSIGLACSYLFMLVVDVRRGYLRPATDLVLVAALVAGGTLMYFIPFPTFGTLGLIMLGAAIGVASIAALLLIYARRGLPSLPAEPDTQSLHDIADEELGLSPKAVY